MIKLELTKLEYESLLLKYELGKLIEGDIIEEDGESISASYDLQQKIYKSGFEGGSDISVKNVNRFKTTDEFENQVDEIYGSFINYVLSGDYEKEMENLRKEIEEMKNK